MPKIKYNYIHLLNGKQVEKTEFYIKLGYHYSEVVVYDKTNPLLNVEVFDEKKTTRIYNRLKRTGYMHVFWSDDYSETFQIKKERI